MPFKSDKQRKACFATNGFNGKIDCREWANETKMKYRGKKKMQMAGAVPASQPDPTFGMGQFQTSQSCPPGMYFHPEAQTCVSMYSDSAPIGRGRFGALEIPTPKTTDEIKGSLANKVEFNPSTVDPKPSSKLDPYFALKGVTTGLEWLSGIKERNRQNQYMMDQYSTLGQNTPGNLADYQPNPFSQYAKYGGKLRKKQMGGVDNTRIRKPIPQQIMSPEEKALYMDPNLTVAIPGGSNIPGDSTRFFPNHTNGFGVPYTIDQIGMKGFDAVNTPQTIKKYMFSPQGRAYSDSSRYQANFQTGGRLVDKVPAGYIPVPGQPNYFSRTTESSVRGTVTGQPQASNQDWAAFLASPAGQQWQAKQRQTDTVYTRQPVPTQPVTPAKPSMRMKGSRSEVVYRPTDGIAGNKVVGAVRDVYNETDNPLFAGTKGYNDLTSFQKMNDMAQPLGDPFLISRNEIFGTGRSVINQQALDSSEAAFQQKLAMATNKKKLGGKVKSKYRGK